MNTPASAVPPVPSREAVEALLAQYRRNDGTESPLLTTIRALLAEVERLKEYEEMLTKERIKHRTQRDTLRATVAEQGSALEWIRNDLNNRPQEQVVRYVRDHIVGRIDALASAQLEDDEN